MTVTDQRTCTPARPLRPRAWLTTEHGLNVLFAIGDPPCVEDALSPLLGTRASLEPNSGEYQNVCVCDCHAYAVNRRVSL